LNALVTEIRITPEDIAEPRESPCCVFVPGFHGPSSIEWPRVIDNRFSPVYLFFCACHPSQNKFKDAGFVGPLPSAAYIGERVLWTTDAVGTSNIIMAGWVGNGPRVDLYHPSMEFPRRTKPCADCTRIALPLENRFYFFQRPILCSYPTDECGARFKRATKGPRAGDEISMEPWYLFYDREYIAPECEAARDHRNYLRPNPELIWEDTRAEIGYIPPEKNVPWSSKRYYFRFPPSEVAKEWPPRWGMPAQFWNNPVEIVRLPEVADRITRIPCCIPGCDHGLTTGNFVSPNARAVCRGTDTFGNRLPGHSRKDIVEALGRKYDEVEDHLDESVRLQAVEERHERPTWNDDSPDDAEPSDILQDRGEDPESPESSVDRKVGAGTAFADDLAISTLPDNSGIGKRPPSNEEIDAEFAAFVQMMRRAGGIGDIWYGPRPEGFDKKILGLLTEIGRQELERLFEGISKARSAARYGIPEPTRDSRLKIWEAAMDAIINQYSYDPDQFEFDPKPFRAWIKSAEPELRREVAEHGGHFMVLKQKQARKRLVHLGRTEPEADSEFYRLREQACLKAIAGTKGGANKEAVIRRITSEYSAALRLWQAPVNMSPEEEACVRKASEITI
jgi:hypothetical protein